MTDEEMVAGRLADTAAGNKRCSDYDSECVEVKNHLACWLGGHKLCGNGEAVVTPIADGYCPFLRNHSAEGQ